MRQQHGMRHLPEYQIWQAIKKRCGNPKHRQFKDYGGRGIKMHPAWAASFPAFLEGVGRRPSPELTLDREDNDKGYEPGNMRWTTRDVQNLNQRRTRMVPLNGEMVPLTVAAHRLGMMRGTLVARVTSGMADALSRPVAVKKTYRPRAQV